MFHLHWFGQWFRDWFAPVATGDPVVRMTAKLSHSHVQSEHAATFAESSLTTLRVAFLHNSWGGELDGL